MNKFKDNLVKCLKENDISQVKLAEMIKMSQSVVNNYCTGKREPTLDVLIMICNSLDESADYLLGIEK